jgi:diaminopimelate decarboxylase
LQAAAKQRSDNAAFQVPSESALGINDRGHLTIEGCDSVELARMFGTPLWGVSEATVRSNFRELKKAFQRRYPTTTVAYASKANHSPAILIIVASEGASVDCVSLTQLKFAQAARVPFGRIVFNGNNKTEEELEFAVRNELGLINIDSADELELLAKVCDRERRKARICIRIRGGYSKLEDEDPDFVRAYTSADKFGVDVPSGQALEVFRKALGMKTHIDLLGISHHVGWSAYGLSYDSKTDLERLKVQVEEVVGFALTLKKTLGFVPSVLDLGGGFRKRRDHGFGPGRITSIPAIEEYAETVTSVLNRENTAKELGRPHLILEPGGYIVSDAVTLLSKVGSIKSVESGPGAGKWVALDSSAYAFVRKLIFGFYHHNVVANKMNEPPTETVDLVGPTCAYDNVGDKVSLPRLERGDVIATLDQGSYCETISSQYCGFPRPATILVSGDRAEIIRRRESPEDLLSQYTIPARLSN